LVEFVGLLFLAGHRNRWCYELLAFELHSPIKFHLYIISISVSIFAIVFVVCVQYIYYGFIVGKKITCNLQLEFHILLSQKEFHILVCVI